MKIIAEAGATKINWALIHEKGIIEFNTSGYNPNIADANYLRQLLISGFPDGFKPADVSEILYFGTGCGSETGKQRVKQALGTFFNNSMEIKIMTDLEGAAIAVFGDSQGIIGIIGTGANAGYYNGTTIESNTPSLGYLLGDEGSGAFMGKELIKRIVREELPAELRQRFFNTYGVSPSELILKVYSSAQPSRYLASFVPFITGNINEDSLEILVLESFEIYVEKYLKPLIKIYSNSTIKMIGGVVNALNKQFMDVMISNRMSGVVIIESPFRLLLSRF